MIISLLDKSHHHRDDFDCGDERLTQYLKTQATQDMKRHLAAVYVGTKEEEPHKIIGFYSLSPAQISIEDLPVDVAKNLPKYPYLPAYRIGRLAVDKHHQRRKIGEHLLLDALFKCWKSEIPGFAVLVDSKHENAARFYGNYGFTPFLHRPESLFIPMSVIKTVFDERTP